MRSGPAKLMASILILCCANMFAASSISSQTLALGFDQNSPVSNVVDRRMTVDVGAGDAATDGPYIDLAFWQGECALRIHLTHPLTDDGLFRIEHSEGIHGWQARLTDGSAEHIMYRDGDNFEWKIILADRPTSNVFGYEFEQEGLVFYYQDALSDFAREVLGAKRGDSVVGSYVAYHASKANDRIVISGEDTIRYNYRTGQAFVLYRPRAWDGRDSVWCDLVVDTVEEVLSVIVDSTWLEKAQYPVTIDPTFGNSSVGASTLDWNQMYAYCHNLVGANTYTVPSGATANISKYSVYGSESGSGDILVNMVAFDMESGYPDDRVAVPVAVTVSGGTPGWFHSSTIEHALAAGSVYGVAVGCAPRAGGVIYYNDVASSTATDNVNCTLSANEWTQTTQTAFNMSMYATYTEVVTASEGKPRRRAVVGCQGEDDGR